MTNKLTLTEKRLLFQCKYNEDSGKYEAGSNARFCERSI